METLTCFFGILFSAGLTIAMFLLWFTPLGVLAYIWGRMHGAPATKFSQAWLVGCLVEGGWFYATSVFDVPVPHWFDVIGEMGACILGVAVIIMGIINTVKNAKSDPGQKKDDAGKGDHREP